MHANDTRKRFLGKGSVNVRSKLARFNETHRSPSQDGSHNGVDSTTLNGSGTV